MDGVPRAQEATGSRGLGEPAPFCSGASGLDCPGVGPGHGYLKDSGRVQYVTCSDDACRPRRVLADEVRTPGC